MRGVVAVVGPTGVGKSRLALSLAQLFGGEIINADSRQVYRYMDIGTAKPTPQDRALVPHHLLDLVDPDEPFSVALYQGLAYQAIEEIWGRGRLPLLVGGSGLYIWGVVEGWRFPPIPPNPQLRQQLEEELHRDGLPRLYARLQTLDPAAPQRVDPLNPRRVVRALEVAPPPFPFLIIGLTAPHPYLYRLVDHRVDQMIEQGFVAEVAGLIDRGYPLSLPSMSGVGYRQIGLYLQGQLTLAQAVEQMRFHTHRLARKQYAWFHPADARIHWLEAPDQPQERAAELLARWLET